MSAFCDYKKRGEGLKTLGLRSPVLRVGWVEEGGGDADSPSQTEDRAPGVPGKY